MLAQSCHAFSYPLSPSLPLVPLIPRSLTPSRSLDPSIPRGPTRSMQELLVKFEPPDIMGIPPEPLPPPLFSGDMFSSGLNSCCAVYRYMYMYMSLMFCSVHVHDPHSTPFSCTCKYFTCSWAIKLFCFQSR